MNRAKSSDRSLAILIPRFDSSPSTVSLVRGAEMAPLASIMVVIVVYCYWYTGTPSFIAPEVLNVRHSGGYGFKADGMLVMLLACLLD